MGQQLRPPLPVKLIVGMLSRSEELFTQAQRCMVQLWGPIDIRSDAMAFTETNYYEKEMGPNLLRQFVSFEQLIDPGALAGIKHQSNALELRLAESVEGLSTGVPRPINLDPGCIEPSKLVLATTKNYSHRIYIGQSMYAEATLRYHQGRWQPWPHTYTDYGSGRYDAFLNAARQRLMEQYASLKQNI